MKSARVALDRLCDPVAEVSAHYLIGRDGQMWQMVDESDRAWHAGAGEWQGVDDINSRSIGIELDNGGDHPFSEPLMARLEGLLAGVMSRWDIAPEAVIGHSDLAPGRKIDPGARFDWARLARQGLARSGGGESCACESVSGESFRAAARQIGFTADVDDAVLLSCVRLRYRPWGRGPLCAADLSLLTQQ